MLNELKIKCFLNVAESLSFTEAGKRMFISQQVISKHIANLEDDLGVRLLHRSRNAVELTEAGKTLYAFFYETAEKLDELLEDIKRASIAQSHFIRIGYQNWVNFGPALNAALHELRKNYSDIVLIGERRSPSSLMNLLADDHLDMALVHKRFIFGNYYYVPLIEFPMQIVTSMNNPLLSSAIDYTAFSEEPLLIDALEGESENATMTRARKEAAQYGYNPTEIRIVPNRDSIFTAAELDMGVFVGSSMSQYKYDYTLKYFDTPVYETLCCVWKTDREQDYWKMFAKLLQREYKKREKQFLLTRKWDD